MAINEQEVLKTLEHFGIYQRFECIKCHKNFGDVNLALAHLRGEPGSGACSASNPVECKTGSVSKTMLSADGAQNVQRVGKKEVRERSLLRKLPGAPLEQSTKISPKKDAPLLSKSRKKRHNYSLKEIEMILNKKKKDVVLAKQFGVKPHDIAKYRYLWKKNKKYKNLLLTVPTPENIKNVKNSSQYIKNPEKYNKHYKINKAAKGAQDYKVQPSEEAL